MKGREMRRIRRQELDMTQKELASAMGLTSKTISNRERVKEATIPIIEEMALLYLISQCGTGTM